MKHALTLLLCLALAQCGLSRAWADAVTLPEAPPPAVEPGGPDPSDFAASAPIGTDLAMLCHVPADGSVPYTLTPAATPASPLTLQAGTGADTRLGVDVAGIQSQADREGWGWQEWTICGICIAAVAVASVFIVQATQAGDHTSGDDSSTHYNIGVGGEGNSVSVRIDSPSSEHRP